MEIKTSYNRGQSGLDTLSPSAPTSCKPCENPSIVPILPVRIAFADIYGELGSTEYPTSISQLQSLTSVEQKHGYCLRMLRQGYVYIYDELNNVWSIFLYQPDMNTMGKTESFTKMEWQGSANDEWAETNERNLETVYVPDSTDEIWIAFSEHRWSQAIFEKAQNNDNGFRDNVMVKLNVLDPQSSEFSDNLEQVATYVEDYNSNGLTHSLDEWNILSDLTLKAHDPANLLNSNAITKANSPAIMVALHDPVGVVKEITMAHTNKVLAKNQYLESITYPLTTAHAVDTFLKSADDSLRRSNISSKERDMFNEWKDSVNPEYKSFIEEAEANAQECENALATILNTWASFYQMGASNPPSTPGSLQTHLTSFNLETPTDGELAELITFASQIVFSLGSSQSGQTVTRDNIVSEEAWAQPSNVVSQIMLLATNLMQVTNKAMEDIRKAADAASNLLTDLALPFSLEIVDMKRLDLFQQVNRFQGCFTNKQLVEVDIPVSNAIHELTHGRTRPVQNTKRIRRGHTIHEIQTPTRMFKFDGQIHVTHADAYSEITHKASSAAMAGFALFASALNVATLSQPEAKDQLQSQFGRVSNSKTALVLASIEGVSKLVAIKDNYALQPLGRSYSVRGQLRANQIRRLLSGNQLSDDFIKTITKNGQLSKVPTPPVSSAGSQLLKIVVKIGNVAGVILSLLDIFKAYEAHRRGDNAAAASIAAISLGALTVTTVIAAGLSATATGIGLAIGIALLLTGVILNWFIDDPVTRWLKNGFWGNTDDYLYWDGKERQDIIDKTEVMNIFQAQALASAYPPDNTYQIERYFEREMQEYYELIYWPQKAPPPPQIRGTREVGIWPFNRTTTLTDSNRKITTIRFRLPGFIDGLSNLDIKKVIAWVEFEGVHRRYKNRYYPLDVTQAFFNNMRIINAETGLLESTIDYSPSFNNDQNTFNDLYWDLKAVFFSTGWNFAPTSDIKVPIFYDDYLWTHGWEVESEGGQKALRVL